MLPTNKIRVEAMINTETGRTTIRMTPPEGVGEPSEKTFDTEEEARRGLDAMYKAAESIPGFSHIEQQPGTIPWINGKPAKDAF